MNHLRPFPVGILLVLLSFGLAPPISDLALATGPKTAEFSIQLGMRYSYIGNTYVVGSTYTPSNSKLYYGDGSSVALTLKITSISVAEDYAIMSVIQSRTYATATASGGAPWLAYYSNTARLSTLKNNADKLMYLETTVDLTSINNASPVSSGFTKITVLKGGIQSIPTSATDLFNRALSYRFATSYELIQATTGGTQPTGLALDANTGILTWDTTNVAIGLYSTQVVVINSVSKTPVDFLINVIDPVGYCGLTCGNANAPCSQNSDCISCTDSTQQCVSNEAPTLIDPTPAFGSYFCLQTPASLSITVRAEDYHTTYASPAISILAGSIPTGAVMSAQTGSNPVTSTFSWTPTAAQAGKYSVCFTAIDESTYMSSPVCVYITVNSAPAAPVLTAVSPSSANLLGGSALTISGSGFLNSGSMYCKSSGSTSTLGTYLTSTSVKCGSPAANAAGDNPISVSCACDVWSNTAVFSYFDTPVLTSATTVIREGTSSTVNFVGTKMFNRAPMCSVNGAFIAATVSSATAASCTVPALAIGSYPIALSNEGQYYSNSLQLAVAALPTVSQVPQWEFIPAGAACDVTVIGSGFGVTSSCGIDGQTVTTVLTNSTMLTCSVTSLTTGSHSVIITNGPSLASSSFPFTVLGVPTLASVNGPTHIPDRAATTVIVTGTTFADTAMLSCFVNGVKLGAATFISTTSVSCPFPASENGNYALSVANNGVTQSNSVSVLVVGTPTISSIADNTNLYPHQQAFTSTIVGDRFSSLLNALACRVDSAVVAATFVNQSAVTCAVGALAEGAHTIAVTNDGTLYSSTLSFTIYAVPVLTSTDLPAYIPDRTARSVTLTGTLFMNLATLSCYINGVKFGQATYVNQTAVSCNIPSSENGLYTLAISNNEKDLSNSVSVLVLGTPTASSLADNSDLYPYMQAFTATVNGDRLSALGSPKCQIDGASLVGATVLNATSVTCAVGALAAGSHTIAVSNDGTSFSSTLPFTIYSVPILTSTDLPNHIPDRLARTVTVSGSLFMNINTLSCYVNGVKQGAAVYVSASAVNCSLPASENDYLTVAVSNNDKDLSNSLSVLVVGTPTVSIIADNVDLYPYMQAFNASVLGDRFSSLSALTCKVDNVAVPAVFINTTAVSCLVGALSAGSHTVSVSNDGSLFSTTLSFMIYSIPILTSTDLPAYIPDRTARSVTLTGTLFMNENTLSCYVGGTKFGTATFVSAFAVTCSLPASENGYLTIAVSNNDKDLSNSLSVLVLGTPTVTSLDRNSALFPYMQAFMTGVQGDHFSTLLNLTCRIDGSVSVPVTFVNISHVDCAVGPLAEGGHTIAISNDGTVFSAPLLFTIYAIPVLTSTDLPPYIADHTPRTVTLTGTLFMNLSTLTCHVNGISVGAASFVSAVSVICQLPSADVGYLTISVSNNAHDVSNALQVLVLAVPNAFTIDGDILLFPHMESFDLVVIGNKFSTLVSLGCQVDGSGTVVATFINQTAVSCAVGALSAGLHTIAVSNDGSLYTTPLSFTIYSLPVLTSTNLPSHIPDQLAATATITGSLFMNMSTLSCYVNGVKTGSATYISSSSVNCTIPAADNGYLNVSVSNNGRLLSNRLSVLVLGTPSVSAMDGDTTLFPHMQAFSASISGDRFSSLLNLACRIDGSVMIAATLVNKTSVVCSVGALSLGTHTIAVTNDGSLFSSTLSFVIYAVPVLDHTDVVSHIPDRAARSVTINGTLFMNISTLSCYVNGAKTGAAVYVEPASVSCTLPASENGYLTVAVSNNDKDLSNSLSVLVLGTPTIVSFIGDSATFPHMQAFNIDVLGDRFSSLLNLSCLLDGSVTLPAALVNSTHVTCASGALTDGSHSLTVTNDGILYSSSLPFTIFAVPILTSTDLPSHIPDHTPHTVTLNGTLFMNLTTLSCYVNGVKTGAASYLSSSAVSCVIPGVSSGHLTLAVSNNDKDLSNSLPALVLAVPTVLSIGDDASMFPYMQPFSFILMGDKFSTLMSLGCLVDGNMPVPAAFVNVTVVSCAVGALSAGLHTIAVTNDGAQYTTPLSFTIYSLPALVNTDIIAYIPDHTLTTTTITGFLFMNVSTLSCYVNGVKTGSATYISSTSVSCGIPATGNGYLNVSVSNNDRDLSNGLSVLVLSVPVLTGNNLPVPYHDNNPTVATVTGSLFFDSQHLTCVLDGSILVAASFIDSSTVHCSVPALVSGSHSLTVRNHVDQSTSSVVSFTVYEMAQLTTLTPSYINHASSMSAITVAGTGFMSTSQLTCKVDGAVVPVSFISSSSVVCSPTVMPVIGNTTVSVANDAVNFANALQFNVIVMSPTAAPTQGGTLITISGKNSPHPENGTFQVGSSDPVPYLSRVGSAENRSIVVLVPASSPSAASTTVKLSGDGDFADVLLAFRTYDEPSLQSVLRASLFSSDGGVVTITGSSFTDPQLSAFGLNGVLSCQLSWGSLKQVVPATLIDSTHVTCVLPPTNSGPWNLSVSLVGVFPETLPSIPVQFYDMMLTNVGPDDGGVQVTILGRFMDVSDTFSCLFGNISTPAVRFNDSAVTCTSPAQPAGNVTLSLSRNGLPANPLPGVFTVLAIGNLAIPPTGSLSGGESVTISGRSFLTPPQQSSPGSSSIICDFGNGTSVATVTSEGDVVCPIPPSTPEGQVQLQLVDPHNGWTSKWDFSYYDVPIMSMAPFVPRPNITELINITVTCIAPGLRPATLTYSCNECEFVVPDTPFGGVTRSVLSHLLGPSRRSISHERTYTLNFIVEAPFTQVPYVYYRSLPDFVGNDTVVVVGHVDNAPAELLFISTTAVSIEANRPPSFDVSQLHLKASVGVPVQVKRWATNMQSGAVGSTASDPLWFEVSAEHPAHFTDQPSVDQSTGDLTFTGSDAGAGLETGITIILREHTGSSSGRRLVISFEPLASSLEFPWWVVLIIACFFTFLVILFLRCIWHKYANPPAPRPREYTLTPGVKMTQAEQINYAQVAFDSPIGARAQPVTTSCVDDSSPIQGAPVPVAAAHARIADLFKTSGMNPSFGMFHPHVERGQARRSLAQQFSSVDPLMSGTLNLEMDTLEAADDEPYLASPPPELASRRQSATLETVAGAITPEEFSRRSSMLVAALKKTPVSSPMGTPKGEPVDLFAVDFSMRSEGDSKEEEDAEEEATPYGDGVLF